MTDIITIDFLAMHYLFITEVERRVGNEEYMYMTLFCSKKNCSGA
jgi:hypothetical protein